MYNECKHAIGIKGHMLHAKDDDKCYHASRVHINAPDKMLFLNQTYSIVQGGYTPFGKWCGHIEYLR